MIQLEYVHFAAFDGVGVWPAMIFILAVNYEQNLLRTFNHNHKSPRCVLREMLSL